ncbi:aspartate phosphatase [Bacillus rugosus]|nr:aspartate phosphatase [Bacillus rugosus]MEC1546838.1 aspartate phosphatase [Bacillus rugosus]
MRKCFMPANKFREGIVFIKLKHASVFILAIVLIGFVSIYLTNTQKDVQEARRGHTASVGYFTDGHSFEVASRGHTS